jgi:hypothetical protein
MISLYVKNRPWNGHPKCDFVHVLSEVPLSTKGYRIDRTGARLAEEPTPNSSANGKVMAYLNLYFSWYHPATAWEIEEFKRLGGRL